MSSTPDRPTSVYVIAYGAFVKIGVSHDPKQRLLTMSTAMPEEPTLVAARVFPCKLHAQRAELKMHCKFMGKRVRHRREWFRVHPTVVVAALNKLELPAVVV